MSVPGNPIARPQPLPPSMGEPQSVPQRQGTLVLPLYPFAGLVGTAAGLVLALALIPNAPQNRGALLGSALAFTGGLALAPFLAMLRNPRSIFRIEYILCLSPVYWLLLDLIQGSYDLAGVSTAAIRSAFVMLAVFVCGLWLGVIVRPLRLPRPVFRAASTVLSANSVFRLIVLLWFLAMMKYAVPSNFDIPRMIYALGQSRWAAPWARGALGGTGAIIEHLGYFGYVIPSLIVLLASKAGWLRIKVIAACVLTGIMLMFYAQEGGRRIVGVVVGSAMLYWVLLRPRMSFQAFVKFVLLAVVLLSVLQFILIYRKAGFRAFLMGERPYEMPDTLRVDDNFYRLSQIIELFPERVPFVYEKQIVFTLIRPIPRFLWPGKPVSPGYDFPTLVGERGVSLTSSVIGELYASWGAIAVLLGGFIYGALARLWGPLLSGLANSERLLIYALSALVLFAGVRSMIELVLMSYGLFAWLVALLFMTKRRRR